MRRGRDIKMQNVNIKTNYLDIANCKILLLHNKSLDITHNDDRYYV